MTDEEQKRYFGILVEQILFKQLQLISESNLEDKKELAAEMIVRFYEEYKEKFNLTSIKDVEDELEKVKNNIKKIQNKNEQER